MNKKMILPKKDTNVPGVVYIVATPIGNLADMSPRAVATLQAVDLIAAEDTRHTSLLLKHFQIHTPLVALHEYNERDMSAKLLQPVAMGKSLAVVADAGTPLISDPGYHLVAGAHLLGIKVSPIPGPCAAIVALCGSGLPSDHFVFEGFLPAKNEARRRRLQELVREERTLIFYEAPHRIKATLQSMLEVFGAEREAVIAKELTKLFETIYKAKLADILTWLEAYPERQKGEFVVLVKGQAKVDEQSIVLTTEEILTVLLTQLPLKQAVELTASMTQQNKNAIYRLALAKKS